jgi:hypothetical protein
MMASLVHPDGRQREPRARVVALPERQKRSRGPGEAP